MKLLIAGSRDLKISPEELNNYLLKYDIKDIEEVVSGNAKGIDKVGIEWAELHSKKVKLFLPDWSKGRSAGFVNNYEMAKYADVAIVIHNNSSGSLNMISCMKKLNKQVYSVIF